MRLIIMDAATDRCLRECFPWRDPIVPVVGDVVVLCGVSGHPETDVEVEVLSRRLHLRFDEATGLGTSRMVLTVRILAIGNMQVYAYPLAEGDAEVSR